MNTVRLTDVASRAGVSPATVSRVLNGLGSVGEDRRDRVLRAAEELGYRPNRAASSLRRPRIDMIAALVSDIGNPHFAEMVRGIEDAAYARSCRVLLCNSDESAEKQRSYLEVLMTERIQGVVLVANDPTAPEIAELFDRGMSVVAFDRPIRDPRADTVLGDNAGGVRLATEHLLRAGHEHVGFVSGPLSVYTATERLAGYQDAMRDARREPIVAYGDFQIAGGRRAAAEMLAERPEVTAIVSANNLMSLGVLQALGTSAHRIAMVGFDDPFWAETVDPALTVVAQPTRTMAERAVELLFERMSGQREEPVREIFDVELRVRDSCGTAAPGAWRT